MADRGWVELNDQTVVDVMAELQKEEPKTPAGIPVHKTAIQGLPYVKTDEVLDALMARLADEGLCLVKASEFADLKGKVTALKDKVEHLEAGFDTFLKLAVANPPPDLVEAIARPGGPLPNSIASDSLGLK